ncbi:OLC1v1007738C1 [Oldenlandia corymbosa var. corymbosa]|uniref:OLC1v1007738C1 n=1 Tax=Oldenlandia corymbosa var. corymbosa TaxID=529605 RepID=A0AAV1DMI1_OLDCO|nr:OLC1v1007738C1 [Oldenlandia corymbosa var. corymbosa]
MDRLQWGNRKRLRCVKLKAAAADQTSTSSPSPSSFLDSPGHGHGDGDGLGVVFLKNKITSRFAHTNSNYNASLPPLPSPNRIHRDLVAGRQKATLALSPDKEDRYYTTRGSSSVVGFDDRSKVFFGGDAKDDKKRLVWPKLVIALSIVYQVEAHTFRFELVKIWH